MEEFILRSSLDFIVGTKKLLLWCNSVKRNLGSYLCARISHVNCVAIDFNRFKAKGKKTIKDIFLVSLKIVGNFRYLVLSWKNFKKRTFKRLLLLQSSTTFWWHSRSLLEWSQTKWIHFLQVSAHAYFRALRRNMPGITHHAWLLFVETFPKKSMG